MFSTINIVMYLESTLDLGLPRSSRNFHLFRLSIADGVIAGLIGTRGLMHSTTLLSFQ